MLYKGGIDMGQVEKDDFYLRQFPLAYFQPVSPGELGEHVCGACSGSPEFGRFRLELEKSSPVQADTGRGSTRVYNKGTLNVIDQRLDLKVIGSGKVQGDMMVTPLRKVVFQTGIQIP